MDFVSSPNDCRRSRIQRGISQPELSAKRIRPLELVIGMMPGTMGMAMPIARTSSTKRKYASALKNICVIAESAPAATLDAKAFRSASGERACGCVSG